MGYTKKYSNVISVPTGDALRKLQKESGISVLALSRMSHVSRQSIYRAFHDVEASDHVRLLLYIVLTNPELFVTEFNPQ